MKIALGITAALLLFFMIGCYRLAKQNFEMSELLMEQSLISTTENDMIQENFLKFISDSREAAFEYIEDVQEGLNKFINEVDPIISHWENYSSTIVTPHDDFIKKIIFSYKDLKQLLPKEE